MILNRIKILDPHCVNQIAAGEVVERPLSVVKELIENSLDAAAGKIEISVEGGGTSFIRVKDDGMGILPGELALAILPHATSKITKIEDLNNLQTLGFRGEALPSIASVSRLTIQSRPPAEVAGVEILVEGGELTARSEVGCPSGTTVTVRDLFFNTPARHKFLRSNSTEFGYISDMVSRLALARPDVSFALRHPQNLILNTPGKGDLLETIAAILGNETARKLLPVFLNDDTVQITGFLSPPELVRSSSTGITFLVNGRIIRSQFLNQALKEGYHTLIPSGTYPVAVVSLLMNPADYDVNVHPAKLEVKFNREGELKTKLANAVRTALLKARPVKSLFSVAKLNDPEVLNTIDTDHADSRTGDGNGANNIEKRDVTSFVPKDSRPTAKMEQLKIVYKPEFTQGNNYSETFSAREDNSLKEDISIREDNAVRENTPGRQKAFIREETISDETIAEDTPINHETTKNIETSVIREKNLYSLPQQNGLTVNESDQDFRTGPENIPAKPSFFEELRPLAQLFATYLLCTDDNSLYIIDQHAAHERIQYEELLRLLSDHTISSQILLIPETIELTVQEEQVLLEHLAELQDMGFVLEHFGGRTYFLRGVPLLGNLSNPGKLFRRFLDECISKSDLPSKQRLLEEWIFLLACRSSIKGKENLTLPEMEELIQRLGKTANPLTCPHGRPIIVEVSGKELEKRFSRG